MLENFIMWVFHYFQSLGTTGVFLSMFIENIGIPLPTEIGYVIAQSLINNASQTFVYILFIVTMGHILGSLISYWIGRWGGNLTKKLFKISKVEQTREKLVLWYKRYGNLTVFLTRFVGYVRPWSSYVAGFSDVPFWPFLAWTSLGSLIFNIGILMFSKSVIIIWDRFAWLHLIIIIIAFICFFGILLFELFRYLRKKYSNSRVN